MESTSKCDTREVQWADSYTILTLWSQLQNHKYQTHEAPTTIPYWLCGVNFKILEATDLFWRHIYHTDSVESTSKSGGRGMTGRVRYTILTLWSQLQNFPPIAISVAVVIPYWLCGVNFKMARHLRKLGNVYTILTLWSQLQNYLKWLEELEAVYHTDSVESTSKSGTLSTGWHNLYTILTLWSQLQNRTRNLWGCLHVIPYWLCGVNFKIWLSLL